VHSERNLAAVLERVDRERPLGSPLLAKLRGESKAFGTRQAHGGLSSEQQQTLRTWIESISQKVPPIAKPKVEVANDDETTTEPIVAKSLNERREQPELDEEFVDENLFRRLLRELREETSKPGEPIRSTSDE
jgi:hypothetical protein